jgi:Arc/MetJ-type ribon-helix-helix transcriptional regulator
MANDLSPDTESFIQQEIAVGTFHSRADALEAGMAMLKKRREFMDRLAESRRQLDAGEFFDYDQEGLRQMFEQLIARAEAGAKAE